VSKFTLGIRIAQSKGQNIEASLRLAYTLQKQWALECCVLSMQVESAKANCCVSWSIS